MANQSSKANKLTGRNPLAYLGVDPSTPPQLIVENFQPTSKLYRNMPLGTTWVVNDPLNDVFEYWVLLNYVASSTGPMTANWAQLYPGGEAGVLEVPCDSGTAEETDGILNIKGDSNIATSGADDTVTISLRENITIDGIMSSDTVDTDILTVSDESTLAGTVTLSDVGVGIGIIDDEGDFTGTTGANGQVLIGTGTGVAPVWANITSNDDSITITNGAGTIDLSAGSAPSSSTKPFCFYQTKSVPLTLVYRDGYLDGSGTYILGTTSDGILSSTYPGFDNSSGDFYAGGGSDITPAKFTVPTTGIYNFYLSITVNSLYNISGSYGSFYPYYFVPGFVITGADDITVEAPSTYPFYSDRIAYCSNADYLTGAASHMLPLTAGDIVTFKVYMYAKNLTRDVTVGIGPDSSYSTYSTYVMGYKVA